MIVQRTVEAFGDATFKLGEFAPPDVANPLDLGPREGILSPEVIPADPGASCIVAVIDHAIPFAHHLLTHGAGHSRVAAIWMMESPVAHPRADIPFGQDLTGVEIDYLRGLDGGPVRRGDKALYRELGLIDPSKPGGRRFLRQDSHGAAVACCAAGFLPDDDTGLAHPLIGVSLPDWALAKTAGALMPMLIQLSVCFILARAQRVSEQFSRAAGRQLTLPVVVNMSLGITAGSRDGFSLVERLQDLVAAEPPPGLGPVHFVLSSGNSRQDRVNAVLRRRDRIGWQILPDDHTPSELQIWSAPLALPQKPIRLRLTLPDGRRVVTDFARPLPGFAESFFLYDPHGYELARLTLQGHERPCDTMRQQLSVIVPPTVAPIWDVGIAPIGQWQVQLIDGPGSECDAVIQRDDRLPGFPPGGRQSYFVDPGYRITRSNGQWPDHDPVPPDAMVRLDGTCNAFAWGEAQIRCGAALGPERENPTRSSPYSSLLRNGMNGDLVSTGDRGAALPGILTPGMYNGVMQVMGGTSVATPQAVRWIAARLASGARLETRDEVIAAARAARPGWADPPRVDPPLPWQIRH